MRIIIGIVVALVAIIAGSWLLPAPRAAIEVVAEPIGLGVNITNAVFTSWIITIVMVIMAFVIGRNLEDVPHSTVQNTVEAMYEALMGLIRDIAPPKWIPVFAPIVMTYFFFLLFANFTSLLTPFFGSFGVVHTYSGGVPISENFVMINDAEPNPLYYWEEGHGEEDALEDEDGVVVVPEDEIEDEDDVPVNEDGETLGVIVPIFRAPSSDLNLTLAFALIAMVLVQVFGVMERGIGYFGQFINFKGFSEKGFGMGLIDFLVGILETISELAKVLSFTFRLFGSIFAGEVILIVIIWLVPIGLILVFFGLEIFVGFIQAFVFFILPLVFFSNAVSHHH